MRQLIFNSARSNGGNGCIGLEEHSDIMMASDESEAQRRSGVQGQRICVISGKFLPTYAHVRVDEDSGQIGLLFDAPARQDASLPGSDVVSTNKDLSSVTSPQWYGSELLSRIYEVKPGDLEFGLGCPFAIKEADLTECRYHLPLSPETTHGARP